MSMPEDPDAVPPVFQNGMSADFAADVTARMQAYIAAKGLQAEMLTPLEMEAIQLNVVFEALVLGGFSEANAIRYLAWRQM